MGVSIKPVDLESFLVLILQDFSPIYFHSDFIGTYYTSQAMLIYRYLLPIQEPLNFFHRITILGDFVFLPLEYSLGTV
jgi:hypothetical protein